MSPEHFPAMMAIRILIVDDDATVAELLAEILQAAGYAVCGIARTEDEAVIAAAGQEPDLMIVDLMLKEGDGVLAMERILRSRIVPHIFISGGHLPRGKITLQKPFREDALCRAIDRAIKHHRLAAPELDRLIANEDSEPGVTAGARTDR